MAKLSYHCPGCGNRIDLEARVPAAPRSVMGAMQCGACGSNSFLLATRCPYCGAENFAITTIQIRSIELQGVCRSCRGVYQWLTP